MQNIYIPKNLKAGFQKREGTYTQKLAYVIYYDDLGKLRKEGSWNTWRHDNIEPLDFENEPTSGFVLNKGITRGGWDHFSNARSMIRIYDPRGVEFEISPENLVYILMHTDCSRREIQEDLVYAWHGKELLLLPVSSSDYKEAREYSALQSKKVGARELVKGITYSDKSGNDLVYIGRFDYYDYRQSKDNEQYEFRVPKKYHIFRTDEGRFEKVSSVPQKIAAIRSEDIHQDYATYIDEWLKAKESTAIVDLDINFFTEEPVSKYSYTRNFYMKDQDVFKKISYNSHTKTYTEEGVVSLKDVNRHQYWQYRSSQRYYYQNGRYQRPEEYQIEDWTKIGKLVQIGENGERYEQSY